MGIAWHLCFILDLWTVDVYSTRASGLQVANLTRQAAGPDGRTVVYTAVDLETTGLSNHDRIIELAAVVFRGDGEILDEYATLVNPVTARASATKWIHGLSDADVADAPIAAHALGEFWRLSAGTVLVAHNIDFERRFLTKETLGGELPLPDMLGVCTLRTSRAQLNGQSHKLKWIYKTATGHWLQDAHSALGDARATAEVLCWMLREAPGGLYVQGWPPPPPHPRYLALPPSRVVPRPAPAKSNQLADFVKRFPRSRAQRPTLPGAEQRYLDLLAEVVADERITVDEAAALEACARTNGLTQLRLEHLHRQAFFLVLGEEGNVPPAVLPVARKRELLAMAEALGVPSFVELFALLVPPEPKAIAAAATKPTTSSYLRGWRIGLDHADGDTLLHLRATAERHGASVAKRLTKTVRFLATEVNGSADQLKAAELGIPIIGPDKAAQILEEAIAAAELAERAAEAGLAMEETEGAASWSHTWKTAENL
jgi:DNA polymerase III subunit epsilon